MKKILVFLLLIFSFLFAGCSSKQEPVIVVKQELICFELKKLPKTNKVDVRVHKDDVEIFENRINELEEVIDIYEFQVDNYNDTCYKLRGEKI